MVEPMPLKRCAPGFDSLYGHYPSQEKEPENHALGPIPSVLLHIRHSLHCNMIETNQENIPMEKLNKQITETFFKAPEGYNALKAHWSGLMQDKERRTALTAAHHLLYLILRGKNWQRGFAPVTNPVKLENGGF